MSKRITPEQIHAAYECAVRVHQGAMTASGAANELVHTHGMNHSTAADSIRNVQHLLKGTCYQRTNNAYATNYYLSQIRKDFGEAALSNALDSVELHVNYYEATQLKRTGRPYVYRNIRYILAEYRQLLGVTTIEEAVAEFQTEVSASLRLSKDVRNNLLPKAGTKPRVRVARIKVFARNPHVVAAALENANGVCEMCRRPAPFARRTDGSPYLEVHHKVPLSKEGDDTLENVEAICANCHRERHFG